MIGRDDDWCDNREDGRLVERLHNRLAIERNFWNSERC
jgi:hypothetical protein